MKGDRRLSACSEKIVRAILAAWNFPRAGVSGAAELHQVKMPGQRTRGASQV
jgi:hypothetical protein